MMRVLMVFVLLAGGASAQWSTATLGESLDGGVDELDIAFDGSGQARAVWTQHSTGSSTSRTDVWHDHYQPATGWLGAEKLEILDGDATAPRIAMDAQGLTVVAWLQHPDASFLRARIYTPGTGWGEPEIVAPATDVDRLWVDARDGKAAILWVESPSDPDDTRLWVARYDGTWRRPTLLGGDAAIHDADLHIADDGDVFAAWRQGPSSGGDIWARRHHQIWLPKEQLADVSRGGPSLAQPEGGATWALWIEGSGTQKAMASGFTQEWSFPDTLSERAYHEPAPVLAAGRGHLVALFGTDHQIISREHTSDLTAVRRSTTWGPEYILEDEQGPILEVDAAIGEDGDVVAMWRQGVIGSPDDHVRTATIRAAPMEPKLHTIDGEHVNTAALAMDPDGNVILLWGEGIPSDLWRKWFIGDLGAPPLQILAPTADSTADATVAITGITRPTARVTIQGHDTPVHEGQFTRTIDLDEGANTITVTATNLAGQSTDAFVQITRIAPASPTPTPTVTPPPPPDEPEYPVPGIGILGILLAIGFARRSA